METKGIATVENVNEVSNTQNEVVMTKEQVIESARIALAEKNSSLQILKRTSLNQQKRMLLRQKEAMQRHYKQKSYLQPQQNYGMYRLLQRSKRLSVKKKLKSLLPLLITA